MADGRMADDYAVSRSQLGTLAHVIRTGFEVESDNEKLRKLCADMWRVMSYEFASDAINDACAAFGYKPSEFECSLRELGVIDELRGNS